MTKKEYMEFHEASCRKMVEITKKKNADYTGIGDDPFANFSRVSAMGLATTEQGFLVRMLDKLSRLGSYIQRGSFLVADESFTDTCLDLANYSILLAGYVESEKQKGGPGCDVKPFINKVEKLYKESEKVLETCIGCGHSRLIVEMGKEVGHCQNCGLQIPVRNQEFVVRPPPLSVPANPGIPDCLSRDNIHEFKPMDAKGHYGRCKHCKLEVRL